MAGHTNGTAKMAKPNVAYVNGKAALGRDLVERVHIVNEGSEEHESQSRLQQTNPYCEENDQCNGNTNEDLPKLPLKGEWTVYVSGKMGDPNLASEGCERGMNNGMSTDKAGVVVQAAAECCQ